MDPSPLEELADAGGASFPHLLAARDLTANGLAERQGKLGELQADGDVSVVLMGSWGRAEVTAESDDDYMLLVTGAWRPEHEVNPALDEVAAVLGKEPGREGLFGEVVFSDFLVKRIGLQEDDNKNLSRRVLLLLESVAALGSESYQKAWAEVLDGYLADARKDNSPPRLLLNDIVRYWRTICVDFAGKQRKRRGEGWGIRNVKLRTSRKLLFAGGLLPVFECASLTRSQMRSFLAERLAMPPTDRIAQAFLRAGAVDAGVRALGAYDQFVGLLNEEQFRNTLESLTQPEAADCPEFVEGVRLGRELQRGLLALLFETDDLAPLVREYAIF
jgi:hypothetical protein